MNTPSHHGQPSALRLGGLMLTAMLVITGCASTEVKKSAAAPAKAKTMSSKTNKIDPYEGFNRSMYDFNMGLDKYVLKPVADSYKFVTPGFMQTGVTNFFTNLKGINVVLNDVLQGKFDQSASDTGRFLTNSTVGVLGLFDVASDWGMPNNVEDFGQTLAVWGVDQGAYLVLPVLGPTTVRDGTAIVVDKAANPGTYVPGTGIVEGINDRANAEGALNFIDEAALDPYVFTRESFLQYRNNLIKDGKADTSNYDLDVDAALQDTESDSKTDKAGKSAAKPPVSNGATNNKTAGSNSNNAQPPQAFDKMAKSFDQTEQKFEQASEKMDAFIEKRKRSRRLAGKR